MTVKIGINGFGRIGRLAFRRIYELGAKSDDIQVVAINDLTSPAMLAHLLKYDSTHGTFPGEVSATDDSIVVDGKKYRVYAEPQAQNIPWVKNDGVEYVLECTGFYTSKAKSQAHLDAGAKRVLISAPAGSDTKTIVYNVNDDTLNSEDRIVSAGSCTTNCLAPLAFFENNEFGINVGTMTTIHAYTSTQMLLDGPVRGGNLRAARSAAVNTIPHSTGAAKAIGLVIPELNGKLNGHAQRVSVVDGSLTELVAILDKKVTADEVNAAIKKHTEGNESFGYNDDEIVSSDVIGTTYGSIFDPTQTEVVTAGDHQLVKTVAWYDNEYGFTCQMIRTLLKFATL
ncbi:type I glyceraldehyde-3-phosphate dehydrogenase [Schleiferilactobacillus perolens]|jgi:glyceraldehyde 3-phosphate dehydrogenase|uniref:Glyceraldehyde-3-phosphate dehydrogenase n=1 Tax=Schleiferilactobacillus perolens DSM 12744 TaxID=1423792 RepID=A0A0R1MZE3_9LACO|nr:type I glyceraldehyde-3-phosphate dehydrogenase [Schleiferilactobacillus perolens]KRL13469.1 glyceraldehyde 3-phosphate dehydrogenase [Schleiferilactobacillus perolens DSM 12744]MCI1892345.1 type I glyceraldehyde-3-phosphate dehydrogenase [Schleiferilactobacillus harbinensis]MCI1912371.1 type I glyceraldehyde-3-phosphate dehydrogenase [Schleiferilactobacillus harbinensis]MCI2170212.1 type I glyceraldehyde-3-phosphate dehydrogenase [Schleiferilactobacillus perolens]